METVNNCKQERLMDRKPVQIGIKEHALLKKYCEERGLKMNYVITDLIRRYCTPSETRNVLRADKTNKPILYS